MRIESTEVVFPDGTPVTVFLLPEELDEEGQAQVIAVLFAEGEEFLGDSGTHVYHSDEAEAVLIRCFADWASKVSFSDFPPNVQEWIRRHDADVDRAREVMW